ncbi:DNA binding domain-containing protein, excisionase family [Peptoclostridium litorale DSM 5388]|uniref:Helix-turn-helix domain-containing protein n=1 Tax=Peptoclostridium litorale DSM 5388 TaxID=1121324 RepID=A0A069RFY9_PEPLI|nr:helix-turn-helix domain-containing protein [Peptoclostridium litorale]KDR95936.1 hypothetical protein CLIT_8c01050 [Peptoclostridium litorale DSM 5388]SIO09647.1 DNA binding domain-containing protein, excisionase family [Peptoclostridium litorale DSM 5388]
MNSKKAKGESVNELNILEKIMESISEPYPMPSDYLYTVSETAKILRMNPNAVYDLIKKNLLSATRLGRIKVRKKEIEKFMERIDGKDLSDLDNVKELKL